MTNTPSTSDKVPASSAMACSGIGAGTQRHFFGHWLVDKGVVARADLERALERQVAINQRIGDLAVAQGVLDRHQTELILKAQRDDGRPFGAIGRDLCLLSLSQLDELLFLQQVHSRHLGEILEEMGVLSGEVLGAELEQFSRERRQEQDRVLDMLASVSCPGVDCEDVPAAIVWLEALRRTAFRYIKRTLAYAPREASELEGAGRCWWVTPCGETPAWWVVGIPEASVRLLCGLLPEDGAEMSGESCDSDRQRRVCAEFVRLAARSLDQSARDALVGGRIQVTMEDDMPLSGCLCDLTTPEETLGVVAFEGQNGGGGDGGAA